MSMAHVVVDRTDEQILTSLAGHEGKMLNIARLRAVEIIR